MSLLTGHGKGPPLCGMGDCRDGDKLLCNRYTETPHNYHVYFPNSRMTVMRRDIKFNEVKAMQLSLERELHLHAEEEVLPKYEPLNVDQPQQEIHGVEESTHAEPNIKQGRKRTTEDERLKVDATQNVGVPTSQRR